MDVRYSCNLNTHNHNELFNENNNNNILILKELINSNLVKLTLNQKLSTTISTNEERLGKLEEKIKNLKEYKHIVNSSTQIQCKVNTN